MQKPMENRKIVVIWEFILHFSNTKPVVISKLVRFSIFGLVILCEFDEAFLEFIISRDFSPAARCSDSKHDLSECILTFV